MPYPSGFKTLAFFSLLTLTVLAAEPPAPELRRGFEHPPAGSRIMMRWWWFGPAVTKPELEREMRAMKDAGIGGVEVQPVYPLALDDSSLGIRNLPYLSDDFQDALRFTEAKARELGLRMDLTIGSGWPYGGPHIPVAHAAGRLRSDRVKVAAGTRRVPLPAISEGERLIAAFVTRDTPVQSGFREVGEIKDGALWLPPALDGPQAVHFFISGRTGMMVKRAAVGAEGFVLDHYDRTAIDIHLKTVGDRLLSAFGSQRPTSVFCDSLEVFAASWTGDFLAEFQKRRGYDLKPHLPELVSNQGQTTRSLREDWGRTLTELAEERFLAPMQNWAKANKTLFRAQTYGLPPVRISSSTFVDLPEGEGPQWKTLSFSRWASSANHLYGKPVTSSETFTWLHSPSFRATPLDVKAEADLHFLSGINQLIGHGWPYTAAGQAYPGWRLYAAMAFSDTDPWWPVMPDISAYLQRLSFLLRQGRPANDVAIYLSNSDGWASMPIERPNLVESLRNCIGPNVVPRVLESGYGFDFVDDGAIEKLARVEKGAFVVGTNRYRAIVLPNVERIPAGVLKKFAEFAAAGGAVIATRRIPDLPPGFAATDAQRAEVRDAAKALFAGRLVADEDALGAALAKGVPPDVAFSPAAPEMGFVHRSADGSEIYFVANTGNTRKTLRATFRVSGLEPEYWDPMNGRIQAARVENRSASGVTLALDIEPYGSRVIVFSAHKPEPAPADAAPGPSLDLSAAWTVKFPCATLKMDTLRSWTEDERTRYYSGAAAYEKSFSVPEEMLAPGAEVRLSFGDGQPVPPTARRNGMRAWMESPVREAAVVWVNGQRAGSVWCPPYSLDVTRFLRRGENLLKIETGNLAINYMAGHALPNYHLLNLRYGERFQPQDLERLEPLPSGLLGPVRLVTSQQGALAGK